MSIKTIYKAQISFADQRRDLAHSADPEEINNMEEFIKAQIPPTDEAASKA